jgi:uncharacterized protein (TIGR02996 family)
MGYAVEPQIASDSRHADEVALLAACRLRAADDLPRLALADWLDEHDQSDRATFIRVQCELARPSADTARTRELARFAHQLESSHPEWIGPLPDRRNRPGTGSSRRQNPLGTIEWIIHKQFRRGLLDIQVQFQLSSLFEDPEVRAWLKSPHADWLESFCVEFHSVDAFIQFDFPQELAGKLAIVLRPSQQQVTYNEMGQVQMTSSDLIVSPSDWRRFVKCRNFQLLRSLKIQVEGGLHLARELGSVNLSNLVSLHLPCVGQANEAAIIIATTPLPNLSSLWLGPLTLPGLQALCRSPNLQALYELDLTNCQIGDAGAMLLAESPLADSLGLVGFQNKDISDAGLIALIRSPLMQRMVGPRLNLMMNRIGSAGLKVLAECEELLRFRELVLRENQVGNEGAIALAESPYSANLEYIDFWRNRVGDAGAVAMAESPHWNKIVDLSLKENALTAAGREALALRYGDRAKC